MLGVAGQVDLAVLADDAATLVDEDRGVVVPCDAVFMGEFGKTQVEADPELTRAVEQRLGRGIRHRALEIRVDVILSIEIPVREECGKRAFWKHHHVAAVRPGLPHERDQPCDSQSARIGARNRAELRGADGEDAGHRASLQSSADRQHRAPRGF